MKKRKALTRLVQFDAMTMTSAADIRCKGPVFNLGDTKQNWRVWVDVISREPTEELNRKHSFYFCPDAPVALASLHASVKAELGNRDNNYGQIILHLNVRAQIV